MTLDKVEEGASEGDTDIGGLEDCNDELEDDEYIDWAKFQIGENGELSAWDQLGPGYNREFAKHWYVMVKILLRHWAQANLDSST